MNNNDVTNVDTKNQVKIAYQLDSQSKKTLERLSTERIKQSIATDIKIFQEHRLSIKS